MNEFVSARKKKGTRKIPVNDERKTIERIENIKLEIRSSKFFTNTVERLKTIVQTKNDTGKSEPPELVCYGLGNFADSYIARYQLALLLALREKLQVVAGKSEIYDPKFTPEESSVLSQLNFNVLEYNQEGKRECYADSITVFYMPHCGKALYNNLLWRNWGLQLENMVVIGNSFSHMIDSTPRRIVQKTADYVIKIQPYTTEIPLEVPADYGDVFNDTSIHTFSTQVSQKVTGELWDSRTEPVYDHDEAEIILR